MVIGASFHTKVVRGDINSRRVKHCFQINVIFYSGWFSVLFLISHWEELLQYFLGPSTNPENLFVGLFKIHIFFLSGSNSETFIIPYVAMEIFTLSRLNEDRYSIAQNSCLIALLQGAVWYFRFLF